MSIEYEIDPEELCLLEHFLRKMKTDLDVRELCKNAWRDFNIACDEGWAIEWPDLDPEKDDLELERYMLDRYMEMRHENQVLKQKIERLQKILQE